MGAELLAFCDDYDDDEEYEERDPHGRIPLEFHQATRANSDSVIPRVSTSPWRILDSMTNMFVPELIRVFTDDDFLVLVTKWG